jgi:hypothetical protein
MRPGYWRRKRNRIVSFNFAGIEGTEWWAVAEMLSTPEKQ